MKIDETEMQVDASQEKEMLDEISKVIWEIEADHRNRMSKFYKGASVSMFMCAIALLLCIIFVTLAWFRSTPKHPVFRFFVALFDFAIMIFDLHRSHKYARLAKAYLGNNKPPDNKNKERA